MMDNQKTKEMDRLDSSYMWLLERTKGVGTGYFQSAAWLVRRNIELTHKYSRPMDRDEVY